jgi:hypothetical protein
MKRPSNEKILEVVRKKKGRLTIAAKALNVSIRTIYDWFADENLKKALQEIKDEELDFAEDQLHLLMKGIPEVDEQGRLVDWKVRPDNASIMFYLKTQGKNRGYLEKTEMTIEHDFKKGLKIGFDDDDS